MSPVRTAHVSVDACRVQGRQNTCMKIAHVRWCPQLLWGTDHSPLPQKRLGMPAHMWKRHTCMLVSPVSSEGWAIWYVKLPQSITPVKCITWCRPHQLHCPSDTPGPIIAFSKENITPQKLLVLVECLKKGYSLWGHDPQGWPGGPHQPNVGSGACYWNWRFSMALLLRQTFLLHGNRITWEPLLHCHCWRSHLSDFLQLKLGHQCPSAFFILLRMFRIIVLIIK